MPAARRVLPVALVLAGLLGGYAGGAVLLAGHPTAALVVLAGSALLTAAGSLAIVLDVRHRFKNVRGDGVRNRRDPEMAGKVQQGVTVTGRSDVVELREALQTVREHEGVASNAEALLAMADTYAAICENERIRNGLAAARSEPGVDSTAEAIERLAVAYTGWDGHR